MRVGDDGAAGGGLLGLGLGLGLGLDLCLVAGYVFGVLDFEFLCFFVVMIWWRLMMVIKILVRFLEMMMMMVRCFSIF